MKTKNLFKDQDNELERRKQIFSKGINADIMPSENGKLANMIRNN